MKKEARRQQKQFPCAVDGGWRGRRSLEGVERNAECPKGRPGEASWRTLEGADGGAEFFGDVYGVEPFPGRSRHVLGASGRRGGGQEFRPSRGKIRAWRLAVTAGRDGDSYPGCACGCWSACRCRGSCAASPCAPTRTATGTRGGGWNGWVQPGTEGIRLPVQSGGEVGPAETLEGNFLRRCRQVSLVLLQGSKDPPQVDRGGGRDRCCCCFEAPQVSGRRGAVCSAKGFKEEGQRYGGCCGEMFSSLAPPWVDLPGFGSGWGQGARCSPK